MKATGKLEATEVIRGVHSHAMVILDNDGSNGMGGNRPEKVFTSINFSSWGLSCGSIIDM